MTDDYAYEDDGPAYDDTLDYADPRDSGYIGD